MPKRAKTVNSPLTPIHPMKTRSRTLALRQQKQVQADDSMQHALHAYLQENVYMDEEQIEQARRRYTGLEGRVL